MHPHYLRRATLLTLPTIVALFFLVRSHLYVLGQVLYTYSVFHQQDHGVLNYPLDDAALGLGNASKTVVPAIIHQIWLDEHDHSGQGLPNGAVDDFESLVPARYHAARQTCLDFHPGWEFKVWTKNEATDFVAREYPSILSHYLGYGQTIQRTNILRYLVLHRYGGVYLDLDIACRESLEELRWVPWLTPAAHPAGINNAFILSQPRHPFLTSLIDRIPSHDLSWPLPYVENMLTTGCMFISMEYARFGGWDKESADLRILAVDGHFEPQMLRGHVITPLFEHAGESSWHSWDGQMMIFAGETWKGILGVLLILILLAASLVWRLSGRRHRNNDNMMLLMKEHV